MQINDRNEDINPNKKPAKIKMLIGIKLMETKDIASVKLEAGVLTILAISMTVRLRRE